MRYLLVSDYIKSVLLAVPIYFFVNHLIDSNIYGKPNKFVVILLTLVISIIRLAFIIHKRWKQDLNIREELNIQNKTVDWLTFTL